MTVLIMSYMKSAKFGPKQVVLGVLCAFLCRDMCSVCSGFLWVADSVSGIIFWKHLGICKLKCHSKRGCFRAEGV